MTLTRFPETAKAQAPAAPLPCGCVPHRTEMRAWWGFYCHTEQQPYCNFECPHEDTDG